jgi:hypothetical protein
MGRYFSITLVRTLACNAMVRCVMPAVALVLTAAGCGGAASASSPTDAVRSYNSAVADGDGARACGLLDGAARKELQDSTQGAIRGSCRQVIEALAAFYDDATKQRLRDAQVDSHSDGDRGTATFASPVTPGQRESYQLQRVDGGWKIASLGIGTTGP